jgi:hypothetical protein
MGTWGPGLYANDLAKDLKSTIASVMKLPHEPADLVRILEDSFPAQSSQEGDEDYTSFWLVVAHDFHKCGVNEPSLFQRAIEIVDSGMDLQCPERQEMSASDQRKRKEMLAELRVELTKPPPIKKRKTLSKPQPLVLSAGDLFIYPVFEYGQCVNPYSSRWNRDQEAWGAACILRSGHVFEYLACYWPLVLSSRFELACKPTTADLQSIGKQELGRAPRLSRQLKPELEPNAKWELKRPGTCSKIHFQRLQLEILCRLHIEERALARNFPEMRDGKYQTVNDISISASLGANPESDATLDYIERIVE